MRSGRLSIRLVASLIGACTSSIAAPPDRERSAPTPATAPISLSVPIPQSHAKRSGYGGGSILPKTIEEDLAELTKPAWQGRGTGTDGAEQAALFLEGELRSMGVTPANGDSFRQPFELELGATIEPETSLSDSTGETLTTNDFTPLGASPNGSVKGGVVFVGYGRGGKPLGGDDYKGLSAKGKLVVIIREVPEQVRGNLSVGAFAWYQLYAAKSRGAKGVIFVSSMPEGTNERDELPSLERVTRLHTAPLFLVQVKRRVLADWLALSDTVGDAMKPRELPLKVSLSVKTTAKKITQYNIVGRIKGTDETAAPIVIGAHYDHVGTDMAFSMSRSEAPVMHLGADDNASGTSAVLSLAYALKTSPEKRRRDVLVSFFAAEELGLLGSQAFVKALKEPKRDVFAMLNLDMVGRFQDTLYVLAADSSVYWPSLLAKANASVGLHLFPMKDKEGRSDHASFVKAGVPSLLFFTWFHQDYHTPTDTKEKINVEKLAEISRLIFELVGELDKRETMGRD